MPGKNISESPQIDSGRQLPGSPSGFSATWTSLVVKFRAPFDSIIKRLAIVSATNPKMTIALVVLVSLGLMGGGLATNFRLEVDENTLWTPQDSFPSQHLEWINEESGFPVAPRQFNLFFHQNGDSLINREQVSRVFQAVDTVRSLPGYDSVCQRWPTGTCQVAGITNFWDNNSTLFEEGTASDDDIAQLFSADAFPDGTPTIGGLLVGKAVYEDGLLTSAQSMTVSISLPEDLDDTTATADFEELAVNAILDLDEGWTSDSPFRVEVFAERSFADEFQRSILSDIPLVPVVFAIMGVFTSVVFWKRDRVRSRSLLGLMAVVSVLLSIMAGYGLMFVCGVPFTSMTQILPFM